MSVLFSLPKPSATVIAGSGLSTVLTNVVVNAARIPYASIKELAKLNSSVVGRNSELAAGHTSQGAPI